MEPYIYTTSKLPTSTRVVKLATVVRFTKAHSIWTGDNFRPAVTTYSEMHRAPNNRASRKAMKRLKLA